MIIALSTTLVVLEGHGALKKMNELDKMASDYALEVYNNCGLNFLVELEPGILLNNDITKAFKAGYMKCYEEFSNNRQGD